MRLLVTLRYPLAVMFCMRLLVTLRYPLAVMF